MIDMPGGSAELPARRGKPRAHPGWGWLCIALGLFPLALALDLLPQDPARVQAPLWVLALCGIVFISGGCMILLGQHARLNDLLAGMIAFSFAAIGFWVALLAPVDGFSGGLFFLSREGNVMLGRWLFGGGAVMSLLLGVYALHRARGDD